MPTTTQLRQRLIEKLQELFQLNQPDLDFGFYKIMHAKAEQVTQFIDQDLLKIIEKAFGAVDEGKRRALQQEYEQAVALAKSFGAPNPEETDGVKAVKAKLAQLRESGAAEGEIYDRLYGFFSRYYEGGDFMSQRFYGRETAGRAATYAIPYGGEEVKLHWANADQFYIKTAEYFNRYTVNLREAAEVKQNQGPLALGLNESPLRVTFNLVAGSEGEHGNVKAGDNTKRFFRIDEATPVELSESGELVINFVFRPDPEKGSTTEGKWRETRNQEAVERVLAELERLANSPLNLLTKAPARLGDVQTETLLENQESASNIPPKVGGLGGQKELYREFLALLKTPAPTDKQKDRPLLAKYINQYTARNTMDYFIHKDLGSFLRRELDFYIKNEVMRLDDIENADAPAVESYLAKIKVLRSIARQLIDFLAQLEDFQKKLWLKKKFVTETNYCLTLDRVPESFYPEIAANEAQREEWVRLFAIDEITSGDGDLLTAGTVGYSEPLTVDFLGQNQFLVLDTAFFGQDFKAQLLASIDNFDDQCDGLLIHSENFQALNLLQERYREQVKCVYIDPPYNTKSSSIPYKNNYKHSSWGTLINDRVNLLHLMMSNNGAIFVSIDKEERLILESVLNNVFGDENKVEELIWAMNTNNSQAPNYSTNHEYIEVYAKNKSIVEKDKNMFREPKPGYDEVMELVARLNLSYPSTEIIEEEIKKLYERHKIEYREEIEAQGLDWEEEKRNDPWKGLYNYNNAEYRDENGKLIDPKEAKTQKASIWIWASADSSMPASKQAESTRNPDHPNWRFYRPPHPVTQKPCPHPKSGWKFAYTNDENSPDRRSFVALDNDSRIAWGEDETNLPRVKRMLNEVETNVGKSVFSDYSDGEKQSSAMFGQSGLFLAPKHANFVARFIEQATYQDSLIVDCFGGTGSTAHGVIKINRMDRGKRKYILIEMGKHFNTILKPRIQKVVYAQNWKDGKPKERDSGISHCFKYLRLESYEDTLNNLELNSVNSQFLRDNEQLQREYLLHYLLDIETKGSQSLLNIDNFANPTDYRLKIKIPGTDEYQEKAIDLIETFNYLIGLRVISIDAPQRFRADTERQIDPELPDRQEGKLVIKGKLKSDPSGPWWFRKIEGTVPKNPHTPNNGLTENVLIVWRNLTGDLEQDNLILDEWFQQNRINPKDFEYDIIYVNGSNNLPNLLREEDHWKVRLIEETFHQKMWDMGGF